MNIGSARLILNVGEKVLFDEHEYEICDVGFRSPDGSFVSGTIGELHYHLLNAEKASIGWVLSSSVASATVTVEEDTEFFDQDGRSPHLEELGYSMVGWLDGLPSRPDNDTLVPVVTLLMAIQYDKEGFYGSSWKGKGEYRGIMGNIDRKYDRLDKMTEDELAGKLERLEELEKGLENGEIFDNRIGESKVDAVADLANYCLLYLGYIQQNFPNIFNIWVKRNVPEYLAEKIPFLQTPTEE